jgi:HD superfamily phosphohydrolase YqeK
MECAKAKVSTVDAMQISGIRDKDVVKNYYLHTTPEGQEKVLEMTGYLVV